MSLLRDLNKLGEDLAADADSGFLPVGFERKPVAIVVDIATRGGTLRVNDTRSPDNRRGVDRAVPFDKRQGTAAPPYLICDNLQYVVGLAKGADAKSAAKAADLQRRWVNLLRRAGVEIGGRSADALAAIADAMSEPSALVSAIAEKGIELPVKPDDAASLLCTFLVDGEDPLKFSELREWWATLVEQNAGGLDGVCQVTDVVGPIARKFDAVHLPGGSQPTLISANFEAAERYSGSQSTGARISVAAAKRTHAALNWLLDSDTHHARLGEATLVWWVPDAPDDNLFASLIDDPSAEHVQALTRGLWSGRSMPLDDHATFRAVLLTVSTGRVVIRSDQTVALSQVVRSLGDYFAWHQVPGNGQPRYFPLRRLAEAATRIGKQGPQMAHVNRLQADLLTCAISGRSVPKHYLGAALRRCHAERTVPDNRAALISLILRSNAGGSPVDRSDAYRCGQIFAEYEYLQFKALGKINRTVGDTYFATAISHPARVIPSLEAKARHHLGKLRRDNTGAQLAIARRLAELNAGLMDGYPSALSIEQQAEFVLGYHSARNQHLNPPTKENTQ